MMKWVKLTLLEADALLEELKEDETRELLAAAIEHAEDEEIPNDCKDILLPK